MNNNGRSDRLEVYKGCYIQKLLCAMRVYLHIKMVYAIAVQFRFSYVVATISDCCSRARPDRAQGGIN